MHYKRVREAGGRLGRAGLAKRALEIAKEMINDGSYKEAIRGAGKLKVIAQACGYDGYWDDMTKCGEMTEIDKLEYILAQNFEQ